MNRYRGEYVYELSHYDRSGRVYRVDRVNMWVEEEAKSLKQAEKKIISRLNKRHRAKCSSWKNLKIYFE